MNHIMKYYERHSLIKMTLTQMASTEAYIITSTILSLYFIAKNQFLHGETELNFYFRNPTGVLCYCKSSPYSAFAG